ncbi:MAG: peptidylprolyl isomerase [Phycisphaerae bacterium]|nr:peptidylprolyl isomerase [Phycisphaerae bacterium]
MAAGSVPSGKLMAFVLSALLIWPATGCSKPAEGLAKESTTKTAASQRASERILVRIGDKAVVTQADVERLLRTMPPEKRRVAAQKALGTVLSNTVFSVYLDEHPELITQEDIDREIQRDVKVAKLKSVEDLKRGLDESGVGWKRYLEQLRIRIGHAKLSQRGAAKAKDEEYLRKLYDEHPDYYNDTRVKLRHIVFAAPVTSTPEQKKARREALARLREEIVSGKKTWDEAVKLTNDNTRAIGGLLGTMPRYMRLNEALISTAWSLEPGQISEVVETGVGYHIVQVLERIPGRRPFDDPHTKFQMRSLLQARPVIEAVEETQKKYPVVGVQPIDLASIMALPPPASKPAATRPAKPSTRPATRPATRATATRPATRPAALRTATRPANLRPATRPMSLRPATRPAAIPSGIPVGVSGAKATSQPS